MGPSLSTVSTSTKCTVCHGWTLTKNLSPFYRCGCLFAEETSLIICEKSVQFECMRPAACVCVCVCERLHVSDNNKASENEEELKCVSHFSFPCSGACQKKALHFERWLRQQKVNNKPSGSRGQQRRKKRKERKEERKKGSGQTSMTNTHEKTNDPTNKQSKDPNIKALIIPQNMP